MKHATVAEFRFKKKKLASIFAQCFLLMRMNEGFVSQMYHKMTVVLSRIQQTNHFCPKIGYKMN